MSREASNQNPRAWARAWDCAFLDLNSPTDTGSGSKGSVSSHQGTSERGPIRRQDGAVLAAVWVMGCALSGCCTLTQIEVHRSLSYEKSQNVPPVKPSILHQGRCEGPQAEFRWQPYEGRHQTLNALLQPSTWLQSEVGKFVG